MPPRSRKIEARPYKDRHGKTRWRVRVGKQQRNVPPPSAPNHRIKMAQAVAEMEAKKSPYATYSLSWVIADYQATSPYWKKEIGEKTRKDKGGLMRRMEKVWGQYDMRNLTEAALVKLMDTVPAGATHNRMKTIWNQLFNHMKRRKWRMDNPADAIERRNWKKKHTHIWTDAERKMYCDHWPLGTKQRLAYHLMFDTRQASVDAGKMSYTMVTDGFLEWVREKTQARFTVVVTDDLRAAYAPFKSLTTFMLTEQGKPYSKRGIHNAISKWIAEAGLPDRLSQACRFKTLERDTCSCRPSRNNGLQALAANLGAFRC